MRDDPKWRAQELAYDALETDDFIEALRLVNEALELDPNNVDASRLMVSLLPAELDNKIHLMREVVAKGEQGLGPQFFAENAGHFWGDIQTRPYMRAKQHLAELLAEAGEFSEAITIYERMLELNPDDNQAVRSPLLGLYLAEGRAQDAAGLLDRFAEEDALPTSAWGRVMERWLTGDTAGAEAALERARKVNPFAEKYLSGVRQVIGPPPEFFQPAKESGGQVCAQELGRALEKHPGFREWLRAAK
jgi:tetratricopeptide (TPR) repeat protein